MGVIIDTNILLRSIQPSHPLADQAIHAVSKLLKRNETVFFCPQNIAEFWNVVTRPTSVNGLGMSHEEALQEVAQIEALLVLLPDTPGIYPEWKRIVKEFKVQGVKVYDARIVALANVYGVDSILTFNVSDFKRYTDITAINPSSLLS